VLGGRHEDACRVLQQLLRPDAEDDVLALRAVQLGDQDLEVGVKRRAIERVAVGLGEFPEDRVDRGFAGTERVLIAADTNGFHSRREVRSPGGTLAALLHRFSHEFLVTARGHEGGSVRAIHSQALKETAARHRHGIPPSARRLPT
jgi:hypothetical protein